MLQDEQARKAGVTTRTIARTGELGVTNRTLRFYIFLTLVFAKVRPSINMATNKSPGA